MIKTKDIMIGFYSKSDVIATPWGEAGVECHLFDLKTQSRIEGNIVYHGGDIRKQFKAIGSLLRHNNVLFIASFPPCTDLAVSGAKHFDSKAKNDAMFWAKAMELVWIARDFSEASGAPYFLENPKSVISTLWRQPDFKFNPCDFGGYLPEGHQNKLFPDIYPSQDAYKKETWLWTGSGFVMPELSGVEPVGPDYPGFTKLVGKSERTKEIRSVTPEGFARAVFQANYYSVVRKTG